MVYEFVQFFHQVLQQRQQECLSKYIVFDHNNEISFYEHHIVVYVFDRYNSDINVYYSDYQMLHLVKVR